MSDINWYDIGAGPVNSLDSSQLPGSSSGSSGFGAGALGLGALAIGGAGLGAILAQGESPLPSEFSDLTATVPTLQGQGATLFGEGQALTAQGTQALQMAQEGKLTPEQQAQLGQYESGLKNTALQTYAGMGRNPNQDTSFISTQADIDAKVNAMAQQQIQTTIQLGLGELSSGGNFSGQGLQFESAANQALITAGQAQMQQDAAYRNSLTSAFSAIGQMFGSIGGAAIKAAPMLALA